MHLHAADTSAHIGDSTNFDVIVRTLSLLAPTDVSESDGSATGVLTVSPVPTSDQIVTLTSSDPNRLTAPATITIPAGQSSVAIPLTLVNNALLDGIEPVTITAILSGYSSSVATVNVHDDESASLTVTLPASAREGDGTLVGTVAASAAPTRDVIVQLSSSNTSRLTTPTTVTLKAGQTMATFNFSIVDNTVIDGLALVTVKAAADNWISGFNAISVQDNDSTMSVTLPASGWEGQTIVNGGTVRIGGALTAPLVVSLASDHPSLTVPTTVTIPAGQTSATFSVAFTSDTLKNGTRTANVTASAVGSTEREHFHRHP